jgi:hypothetical protein
MLVLSFPPEKSHRATRFLFEDDKRTRHIVERGEDLIVLPCRYLSYIVIVFLAEIHALLSTRPMSSNSLQASSETYLRLKDARGRWHNEERNSAIDDFEGDRHRA